MSSIEWLYFCHFSSMTQDQGSKAKRARVLCLIKQMSEIWVIKHITQNNSLYLILFFHLLPTYLLPVNRFPPSFSPSLSLLLFSRPPFPGKSKCLPHPSRSLQLWSQYRINSLEHVSPCFSVMVFLSVISSFQAVRGWFSGMKSFWFASSLLVILVFHSFFKKTLYSILLHYNSCMDELQSCNPESYLEFNHKSSCLEYLCTSKGTHMRL